jgi:hypothetical protein
MNEYQAILREIDDQVINLQNFLSGGGAKDYANYQNICGKISGLLSTRRYIEDLQKYMENHDE